MDNKYINIYSSLVHLTRNKCLYERFTKQDTFSDRITFFLFHFAFLLKVYKNECSKKKMQDIFHGLVGNVDIVSETLIVDGRSLKIPRVNQGLVWFTFEELCGRSLGAADYLEIAGRYHTLLLSDIPVMTVEQRDKAKRFAILIDILYEHNVKLVCSAAGEPKALCPPGNDAYEFNRTVSRLSEMQTATYLSRPHTA